MTIMKAKITSEPLLEQFFTRVAARYRPIYYLFSCLLLLGLTLWLMRSPGVLVVMGPSQTVVTRNSKIGVHTRLSDEVEEWKIQRTLELAREMGATWIVEYFPWAYIETDVGTFDWEHTDMIIEHARHQGLTVIARLGMVPEWARPDPDVRETTNTYLAKEHYADFANFAGAFAQRYAGRVDHLIIWNEPNLKFEWGYREVDPAGYAELLKVVYPVAHAANPDVVILGGALAPTLEPENGHAGLNDLRYLEQMYAAGAAPYFDALAAHAYGLVFPPEIAPDPELLNFRRVELLRAVMDKHGDEDKPIYVTESGWNDHPRWSWAVRPSMRVAYTLDAYEWAQKNWPWCPAVVMWVFRTPVPQHNYQDYFSFVTPDLRPRPIYEMIRAEMGPAAP